MIIMLSSVNVEPKRSVKEGHRPGLNASDGRWHCKLLPLLELLVSGSGVNTGSAQARW